MSPKGIVVIIAPNEDGLGTSAWVTRLTKELCRQGKGLISRIKVVVATPKRHDFHSDKYEDERIAVVALAEGSNSVELIRKQGAVEVPASIERALLPYAESRAKYAAELSHRNLLSDAGLVIDFGVPQLVRAIYDENLRRGLASRERTPKSLSAEFHSRIVGVTVFDHAWSLTLRKIASDEPTAMILATQTENALNEIESDERLTQEVVLFSDPICPLDYHEYWQNLRGHRPAVIPGGFGGPLSILDFVREADAGRLRAQTERDRKCPLEACEKARSHARNLLGIKNDLPVLFVSGAGTTVWDDVLTELIDSYERRQPAYNVVVFNKSEVKRRGMVLGTKGAGKVELGTLGENERVIFIDRVIGETHHILFPAFDVVLSRAGGGTVNDAIACGVALVLIEEPHMWQVEQIRQSCLKLGIAEGFTLREFRNNPRACVETPDARLKSMGAQRDKLRQIPNHGEIWLARRLLERLQQVPASDNSKSA